MPYSIDKDALVELEFELNHREILHCRSIILDTPTDNEILIAAPIPVEHAYTFKSGDRLDLYISLLGSGEIWHTLHVKTQVTKSETDGRSGTLHLRLLGFAHKISQPHFFMLMLKTNLLIEPEHLSEKNPCILASVHSISLHNMHVTTPQPLEYGSIWQCSPIVNGNAFNLRGFAEPEADRTSLSVEYPSAIRFNKMPDQEQLALADAIESVQRDYIRSRRGDSLYDTFARSEALDSFILQHLVSRSRYRIALDTLELAGWITLVLAAFDVLLAVPPDVNFFDRIFGLNPALEWDQARLKNVPIYMIMESALILSALTVHQIIYYRGNTRSRWSLWLMAALAVLVFLSVRSHI